MIQKENNGSKKIKENKYKILRMSLLLGQDEDREETINNFCDAAREIDAMNNETYLAELEDKFYDTQTLEEESKKLTALVDYIAGRISQRESLISDFINVTGRNLTNLGDIKYQNRLIEYQDRLKYINEYLDNSKKIEQETEELEKLKIRLKEEEYQKEENEKKNEELENLLRKKFTTIASNKIDIQDITDENIDEKIGEIHLKTEESKKSLDIFTKSFETLKNAGISYEDEIEYKSYVSGARDVYYEYKEEEYLLNIYKLLLTNETEYSKVFNKREFLNNILNERLEVRNNLVITEEDSLTNVYNILSHQTQIVEGQKENIDNIVNISAKIKYIEERIEELKEENEKVEILAILKEYNIIDTYQESEETKEIEISINDEKKDNFDIPEFDFPETPIDEELEIDEDNIEIEIPEEETNIEIPEEENLDLPLNKPYRNNFVMGSHDPIGLNVDDCIEKATSVMRRVGKMLNIEIPEETKEQEVINIESPPVKLEENVIEPTVNISQEKEKLPIVSPFIDTVVEPQQSPFINEQMPSIPHEDTINAEESRVKNTLPSADSFWDNQAPTANDLDDDDFPDLTVSNDDFFANNMDNFEFPNLDEFK